MTHGFKTFLIALALATFCAPAQAETVYLDGHALNLPEPEHFCSFNDDDAHEAVRRTATEIKTEQSKTGTVLQVFAPCPQLNLLREGKPDALNMHGVWRTEKPQDGKLFRFPDNLVAAEFVTQVAGSAKKGPGVQHFLENGVFYYSAENDGKISMLALTAIDGYLINLALAGRPAAPGQTAEGTDRTTALLHSAKLLVTELRKLNLGDAR